MGFKENATRFLGNVGMKLDKRSPEIFFVLGTVSVIGAVATAVTSTLKVDKVVSDHVKRVEDRKAIEVGTELKDEKTGEVTVFTEDVKKRTVAIQYVKTGWELTKLYAPTLIFTAAALGCFGASFGILKKRNAALAASLSVVRTAFDEYRGRVVRDLGKDMDEHFLYDTVEETLEKEEVDESGKKHKRKEKVSRPTRGSVYDQMFDKDHDDYSKNSTQSYLALRSHLLLANSLLRSRGHLYFNRALEEFRFDETDALQAGFIYDADRPEESRFIQIRGFGTVREARDHSLYIDDSTMNPYWRDIADGRLDTFWVQFENVLDNIRDDVVRTDGKVRVITGPEMD